MTFFTLSFLLIVIFFITIPIRVMFATISVTQSLSIIHTILPKVICFNNTCTHNLHNCRLHLILLLKRVSWHKWITVIQYFFLIVHKTIKFNYRIAIHVKDLESYKLLVLSVLDGL